MTADPNHSRRDSYVSVGARTSHRRETERVRTRDLGTGGHHHRHRRRRRRGGNPTALIMAVILLIGFGVIITMLLNRGQGQYDPMATISAELYAQAPQQFEVQELRAPGRDHVARQLKQQHPAWFATARSQAGSDQRKVMALYWDTAAAAMAADPAAQQAYRDAGLQFMFRRQSFGHHDRQAEAPPIPEPAEARAPTPPPQPKPESAPQPPAPRPAAEPTPAPQPAAEKRGVLGGAL
ncbi:MAG: hypothetical protein PF961_06415 [Planctomycetota bacterium]|nr:hypothetical protein [Planctomycetota bacterium]